MRITSIILSFVVAIACFGTALADDPKEAGLSASLTPSKSALTLWSASDELQVLILREITDRKVREPGKRWLDELGTLYAAKLSGPLWVSGDAPKPGVRKVMRHLRASDEWGLRAADYRFDIPLSFSDDQEKVRFEIDFSLNVLKYVDHARNGRFRPTELSLWYEGDSNAADHGELLSRLAHSKDPSRLLEAQHPQHEGFRNLRRAYLKQRGKNEQDGLKEVRWPRSGPMLHLGKRHPDVAILRQLLDAPVDPDREGASSDPEVFDVTVEEAVRAFQRQSGLDVDGIVGSKTRTQFEGGPATEEMLLANMEKWRWLPRELGDTHIWNNLPSFRTKVVKNGQVIHEERIIIGKTKTQTPVFSDSMTHVVFKPQWGIPNSIKVKDLLPRLARGDLGVLRRRGMRIQYDGKVVDPSRYDWRHTDIKSIPIVMGAGPSNPLGRVKFMFPNHHAVYMHDTPDRHLFDSQTRTFSHGCIRVRNPVRLAEIVMAETSGWPRSQVAAQLSGEAKENYRVDLGVTISVHNTYFTLIADYMGRLTRFDDIYGHDERIKQALSGHSLEFIAKSDPARIQRQEMARIEENRPSSSYRTRRSRHYRASRHSLGGPSYAQRKKARAKSRRTRRVPSFNLSLTNPFGFGF
jgi:L,D-transpeptidase YcbB